MEVHAELTTPIIDGNMLPTPSESCNPEKYSHLSPVLTRIWSKNRSTFSVLNFLIGSIVCIIISILVQAKQRPLDQIFADELSPSCTDFGQNAGEQMFSLDLTYGNFTFTEAKIIDATWDTVIGQGGRFLHGWILYRCVIYPLLVLAMEISTVSYSYYTTLSFSKASFDTLLQLLKALRLTKSYSVLLCTILSIYTLAYTLLFSLIWTTATGYVSLSHKLYAMPDGDIVPLNSEFLSLCWVLDPERLNLPGPHVEVGPSFSEILSTPQYSHENTSDLCLNISRPFHRGSEKYELQYDSAGWRVKDDKSTIWDRAATWEKLSPEGFTNIHMYALTRQFLQIGLNASGWVQDRWKTNLSTEVPSGAVLDWWIEPSIESQCRSIYQHGLYETLRGVTLETLAQRPLIPGSSDIVNNRPYNESALQLAYWSLFVFDNSIQLGPGIVPYNSSIWLNGSSYRLEAPFLDIGFNCSAYSGSSAFTSLGNCVCYKGQPISLDFLSDDRMICNTAPGYVWGFSSYLTRLGLILEAVWMACCFVAYSWLLYRSKLLHIEPVKSAKTMRLLLDCSYAVHNDVGPDIQDLREDEILQQLGDKSIQYRAAVYEGKLGRCVTSGLEVSGFSERFNNVREGINNNVTIPIETKLAKKAERFETALDGPLNRIANSRIHDTMNKQVDEAITYWKSLLSSWEWRPSENEVYEDVNWRF